MNKNINTKSNFFDHLDGGWGDIIADTYRDATDILLLKLNTHIKDYNLYSGIIDLTDTKEGDTLSIYITNENIKDVLKNNVTTQEYFIEDKNIHINIPFYKLKVYINDEQINSINNGDKERFLHIFLNENKELIVLGLNFTTYGYSYIPDKYNYQKEFKQFIYDKLEKNKIIDDFIIFLNDEIFSEYEYKYEN